MSLECIQPDAAGIDIGGSFHFVAVPQGRDTETVKKFGCFTEDLHAIADWLIKCRVKTAAMEATGVYWIPLFEVLEARGIEVYLVNSRHVKNVSGRKSDVLDCQWIQQLHSFGLLSASFQPNQAEGKLRILVRHRSNLIRWTSMHAQLMQKALTQMNLQLQNAVSDILGETGMKIIRAICAGERDSKKLAQYRDYRCKNPEETIAKSLEGHYREEILFSLKQALQSYDHYQSQLEACDKEIEQISKQFEDKSGGKKLVKVVKKEPKRNGVGFDTQERFFRMLGVNLSEIPGISSTTILTVISEIGTCVDKWRSPKAFSSWLGLCPGTKISGGKRLGGKTKKSKNRAAEVLRMAASTLSKSQTALGAFLRRMKARLGPAKAITATANKMAKMLYIMIKGKKNFKESGADYYEQVNKDRTMKRLRKFADRMGFDLSPKQGFEDLFPNQQEASNLCTVI